MAVSLAVLPAQAADTSVTNFADISDRDTAAAVEALRLLEVLDGYSDGTFRPSTVLTRAQFCKMAVYAMNGTDQLGRYRTVTVFPDVKPSHWAAAYINMAAKGKGSSPVTWTACSTRSDRHGGPGGDDPAAPAGLQG